MGRVTILTIFLLIPNSVYRIHVPKESKRKICCPEVCQDGEKIPLTQVLFNIKEVSGHKICCTHNGNES